MTINSKFNIGEEVCYFQFGDICHGEVQSFSFDENGVWYYFNNRYHPVKEEFVAKSNVSFEELKRQYKIDQLKIQIKNLKTSINGHKGVIETQLKLIEEVEGELQNCLDNPKN